MGPGNGARRLKASRAYLAGIGTTGVLIGSFVLLLTVCSALVAFRGVPGQATNGDLSSIELRQQAERAAQGGAALLASGEVLALADGRLVVGASGDVFGVRAAAGDAAGRFLGTGGGFGTDLLFPGLQSAPVGQRTPSAPTPTTTPSAPGSQLVALPPVLGGTGSGSDTGSGSGSSSGSGSTGSTGTGSTTGTDTGAGSDSGTGTTDTGTGSTTGTVTDTGSTATGGSTSSSSGTATGGDGGSTSSSGDTTGTGGTVTGTVDSTTDTAGSVVGVAGSTTSGAASSAGDATGGLIEDVTSVVTDLTTG